MLAESENELYLSVVCGSVGLFETNIKLNTSELLSYKERGTSFIDELAEKIRNNPQEYSDRNLKIAE